MKKYILLYIPQGKMIIKIYHFEAPHGEEVCHHGAEAGGEAGLGDEAKLELGQADHVVTLLPVPRGDVQQVRLQHRAGLISMVWCGCS